MGALTAVWNRVFAVLGRFSMYRLALVALGGVGLVALALSFFGLVVPGPGELVGTAVILVVVISLVDVLAQRLLRLAWRIESSIITALILLFVLRPTLDPVGLVGIAIAGAAAAASKYLLVWRGRHVLNPAAFGAAFLTVVGIALPALGGSSWWVGAPALFVPVLLAGLVVAWRTEKVRVVALFLLVATAVALVRTFVQYGAAGLSVDPGAIVAQVILASPFLFLGAFMLSEPLTLPPRRRQQYVVAVVVGVLAGWPLSLGEITLGQERALLIGNLVAFAFALRAAVRLTLERRRALSATATELTFRARRRFRFEAGQYLELDVPHRHPDARGTRREFSIVSAPADLPTVRIAFRDGKGPQSSYKRALAAVEPGDTLAVTGVWGDFVLPRRTDAPLLLVAAGIGSRRSCRICVSWRSRGSAATSSSSPSRPRSTSCPTPTSSPRPRSRCRRDARGSCRAAGRMDVGGSRAPRRGGAPPSRAGSRSPPRVRLRPSRTHRRPRTRARDGALPDDGCLQRLLSEARCPGRSGGIAGTVGRAGSRTVKSVRPGVLSTEISPRCASTIARAIESPSPVPPVWRARERSARENRSNSSSAISGSIPGPSSSTVSTASDPS